MSETHSATWERVMQPLRQSEQWTGLRQAAVACIERDNAAMDSDSIWGISSSDVNHTIFSVASFVYKCNPAATPQHVLDMLKQW